jgi:hypothetical protein
MKNVKGAIRFLSVPHLYIRDKTGRGNKVDCTNYTSVTTLIGMHTPEFDTEFWSHYCSIEYLLGLKGKTKLNRSGQIKTEFGMLVASKGYGTLFESNDLEDLKKFANAMNINWVEVVLTSSKLKQQWKTKTEIACEDGTTFHDEQEEAIYISKQALIPQGSEIFSKEITGSVSTYYDYDLTKLEDGVHPEILCYEDEYQIAGKVDKPIIVTENGIRYIHISDYKTNEKLTFENKYENLLYPLNHLEYCKINVYYLQLNLYAWIFKRWGYTIGRLVIEKVVVGHEGAMKGKQIGKTILYEVPDMQKDIEILMAYRKRVLTNTLTDEDNRNRHLKKSNKFKRQTKTKNDLSQEDKTYIKKHNIKKDNGIRF